MAIERFLVLSAVFICVALFGNAAGAQQTLDDIKKQLDAGASELDEVDKLLADTDLNRRIAAMQLLLKSGNPLFIRRAKEAGLFSSDPQMQQAAIKAVFDSGGPFRIIMNLSGLDDDEHGVKAWAKQVSWDAASNQAEFVFRTLPFDDEKQCWPFADGRYCAIYLTGTTVSLRDWWNATGSLELGTDGRLVGTFRSTAKRANKSVSAYIPIAE